MMPNWLRPPHLDNPADNRTARILYALAWPLIIGQLIYIPVGILAEGSLFRRLFRFGSGTGLLIAILLMMWLPHRRRVKLGLAILLGYIVVALTAMSIVLHGGAHPAIYIWYMVAIAVAGAATNEQVMYAIAAISLTAVTFTFGLEHTGIITPNPMSAVFGFASYFTLLVMTAVYVRLLNRAEQRAQHNADFAERKLRTLTRHTTDAIMQIDTQHRITFINMASPEQLKHIEGQSIYQFFDEIYHEPLRKAIDHALTTGEAATSDIEGPNQWHDSRPFNAIIAPIYDEDATQPSAVLLIGRDMTEQRQAQQREADLKLVRERAQMMETFIADVTHDFKTPLTIIGSEAYMAERTIQPQSDRLKERFANIQEQVSLLNRLVDDLLTMSQLNYETAYRTMKTVNMHELLEDVVRHTSALAKQKEITVVWSQANVPMIDAHEDELFNCLENLVENAIYYTEAGGHVEIRTEVTDTHLNISIQDDGIGIDNGDLPHIFERFYRANRSKAMVKRGTGLGLAIVQRVVELHHGEIDVQSVVNQGTTFIIRLPIQQQPKPKQTPIPRKTE